jgi:sulfofructose kinase
MPRILCVGALTMDTIFRLDALPQGSGKFIPLAAVEVAEGMAAAQAATIARLGGEATLWASAGDDATGDRLVAQISAEGVDCSAVRRVPGARSGFATILMDKKGSTVIVPRYDPALLVPPVGVPDMEDIDAVLVDVRWPDAAELALRAAKSAGVPGILDADTAAIDILQRLMPLASHVVASDKAARLLTSTASAPEAAAALIVNHPGFITVTGGEEGCWWGDGATVRHMPAPHIHAVDTLAAGDVFHAAFALLLAENTRPMAEILRFASAAAAIKCTRFGGRLGAPTRDEVEAFLAR